MEDLLTDRMTKIALVCYEPDSWWPVATVLYDNEEDLRKDVQKESDGIPQYNIVWSDEEGCFFCVYQKNEQPGVNFQYYETPWGIIVDSVFSGQ